MNIYGIGTDIVNIDRIKKIFRQRGDTFKNKVYTNFEISKCNKRKNKNECFAKRFAAKEAFVKALGTGFSNNINFKDISIKNIKSGMPKILVNKKVKVLIKKKFKLKKFKIFLSLSDERGHSIAFVILNKL